ncbi:MAG: hypothetical protein RI904_2775, partial [Pseudomonadota bacterium]
GVAMLVTFSSKAGADVLMLSQHAKPLLKIIGKLDGPELETRGVWMPEQLGEAITLLEAAIAQEKAANTDEDPDEPIHPLAQPVSLRQRSFTLLDLFRRAQQKKLPVLWEASSAW